MNVNELTEKNIADAVVLYKESTKEYIHLLNGAPSEDADIAEMLLESERRGDFTYLFYDRGTLLAMATIAKPICEICNMFIRFELVDTFFHERFLEFIIKQFSAITRVFVWVSSTDTKAVDMIESSGFEYTGEQEYLSKENNILRFRYLFKRKK